MYFYVNKQRIGLTEDKSKKHDAFCPPPHLAEPQYVEEFSTEEIRGETRTSPPWILGRLAL
jgi:hypothetical protein